MSMREERRENAWKDGVFDTLLDKQFKELVTQVLASRPVKSKSLQITKVVLWLFDI